MKCPKLPAPLLLRARLCTGTSPQARLPLRVSRLQVMYLASFLPSLLRQLARRWCSPASLACLASWLLERLTMSMLAPFADRAARVRSAQVRHCANAVASHAGGVPFGVVFRQAPHESLGVIGGAESSCSFELASAPGLEQDDVLHINGTAYAVASPVEADSSGWVKLQLRTVEAGHA